MGNSNSNNQPRELTQLFEGILNIHHEVRIGKTSFQFIHRDGNVKKLTVETKMVKDWSGGPDITLTDSDGFTYNSDSWFWAMRKFRHYVQNSSLLQNPCKEVVFTTNINCPYSETSRQRECSKKTTFIGETFVEFHKFLLSSVLEWVSLYVNGIPYDALKVLPPPNFGKSYSELAGCYT